MKNDVSKIQILNINNDDANCKYTHSQKRKRYSQATP